MVKQRTRSDSPITFMPYEQAYEPGFEDMPRRVPALGKLERLTGFLPSKTLPQILDRVIEDMKKNGSAQLVATNRGQDIRPARTARSGSLIRNPRRHPRIPAYAGLFHFYPQRHRKISLQGIAG